MPEITFPDTFDDVSLPELREAIKSMSDTIAQTFDRYRDEKGDVQFDKVTADDAEVIRQMNLKLASATARYEKLNELAGAKDAAERLRAFMSAPATPPPTYPRRRGPERPKTLGEAFVASDHFKNWKAHKGQEFETDAVFADGIKAVLGEDSSLADVGSQYPPEVTRIGVIVDTQFQEPNIGRLIPRLPTSQSAIEYLRETVNAGAGLAGLGPSAVAEGAAATEVSADWVPDTSPVRKIAALWPVTEELLADEPAIRGLIDQRLRVLLNQEEDYQLLKGDGTGQNLTGVLNTAGIGSVPVSLAGTPTEQDWAEAAFRASNLIRQAFQSPGAYVMATSTFETIALAKDAQGAYLFPNLLNGDETRRLWGQRTVINENMDDLSTAGNQAILTADWQMATTVFQRQSASVSVSDSHSDRFARGVLTLRIMERLALVVWRASGIATVTVAA